MIDDKGKQVKEAGPSVPVEVLGLSGVPSAGDTLTVVENEARAREVAAYRQGLLDRKRTTSRAGQPREHVRQRGEHMASNSRWSSRPTCRARPRRSSTRSTASRPRTSRSASCIGRRRDHRKRRDLAARQRRADHRLQRPPQRQGARDRRAQQGRVPLLRRHLPPHRLGEGAMAGELGPEIIETVSAAPRSRKSSRPARRTRPPVCWCSKASSARASTRASPARTSSSPRRPSRRCAASRTTSPKSRRPGMRRAAGRHQRHQGGRHLEVFEVEERARTLPKAARSACSASASRCAMPCPKS
jgi:translation initiation factor IF-2